MYRSFLHIDHLYLLFFSGFYTHVFLIVFVVAVLAVLSPGYHSTKTWRFIFLYHSSYLISNCDMLEIYLLYFLIQESIIISNIFEHLPYQY